MHHRRKDHSLFITISLYKVIFKLNRIHFYKVIRERFTVTGSAAKIKLVNSITSCCVHTAIVRPVQLDSKHSNRNYVQVLAYFFPLIIPMRLVSATTRASPYHRDDETELQTADLLQSAPATTHNIPVSIATRSYCSGQLSLSSIQG